MNKSQAENLAMNAGPYLESQSTTSQAEVERRVFETLAQNVLGAAGQIFPSIEPSTTGNEYLTVEEFTMVKDPRYNDDSGSRVVCTRARVYEKNIRRSVKFHCCCDHAPHESQLDYKVFPGKSLLREEIGLDSDPRWSVLLLRLNMPVIVRLLSIPPLYNGRVQRLANDIGIAYLSDQNKSASKLDTEVEVERFECFQNDWGFPSTKVRTVVWELAGTKRSLDTPSKVVLKHYSLFPKLPDSGHPISLAPRSSCPAGHFHIIITSSLPAEGQRSVLVTTQTRISHENNPLGRLFVTLENVSLTGNDKTGQETHDIKVHFGFDERRDAMCFASYLTVAQGKIYEKFMRGPIYDERVIYYREIHTADGEGKPPSMQFVIVSRVLGESKTAHRAILARKTTTRCICFEFNSKVCDVKKLDLLQSTIWIYDHDKNGNPYISKTDWKTLTGQSLVKSTEAATFVKSEHGRTASDWLEDLDKLFKVMKPDRNDRYEKVKIAVIDSGLNDTVRRRYMTQNDIVYKDFSNETWNDSWHGTCCAKIIGDMYEEAKFFIARVFEEDDANDREGPIRMAKAIDWAISNCVDIISISAGFRDYSKELDEAVTRAKAAGTLVVAAAANWQNTGTVAFPARHNLTTMCIYSTNVGNQSSSFNPEPRSDTPNLAVLGEGFQHPDQKSEPMSGTSMSTAAAVGLAANIIDFARQSDNKSYIYRSQDVGKLPGMLSIFDAISKPAGSLRYVEPLNLLPGNKGYSRERGRQRVREILSQAMEKAN